MLIYVQWMKLKLSFTSSTTTNLGNADVTQHLLDIGCPAAAYDKDGYSAMAHMVEKMPNIALEALSQFISVTSSCDKKSYYLAPLEFNPNSSQGAWDQKTALQVKGEVWKTWVN